MYHALYRYNLCARIKNGNKVKENKKDGLNDNQYFFFKAA